MCVKINKKEPEKGPKLKKTVQRKRDCRKGDWLSFQALMETTTPSDLPCWSPEVLDDELDWLYGDIDSALKSTVRMVRVINKPRPPDWWDSSLDVAKAMVRRLLSCHRLARSDVSYKRLTDSRRAYSKLLKKAKNQRWQEFCNSADTLSKTARLVKVIKNAERRLLGLLRGSDGQQTEGPEEMLELLLQSHFPNCSNVARVKHTNRQVKHNLLKRSYLDFI